MPSPPRLPRRLARAIESARTGARAGARELFLDMLARLIVQAADPHTGDAAFQALLVRANAPSVREYVKLQSHAVQDARAVRRLVDAVAHPARLAALGQQPDPLLVELHDLAKAGRWTLLQERACWTDCPARRRSTVWHEVKRCAPIPTSSAFAAFSMPRGLLRAARPHRKWAGTPHVPGDAAEAATVAALQEIAARRRRNGTWRCSSVGRRGRAWCCWAK